MSAQLAVRARGISKCFGDVVALDEVSLDVASAEVHGLIGPNGAGKTTLLGLLLGLSTPDCGQLEIAGTVAAPGRSGPDGVAGFVDGPALYPMLTARQNLTAVARLRGENLGDVGEVLARVGLAAVADERVRGFSLGMRQRLGLAAGLLTKPRLLVLDEPANGLDPAASAHIRWLLRELAATGTTVIVSSHRIDDLASLCTQLTLLVAGRVVFSGPVAKLAAECGRLDHRLQTSDPVIARRIASTTPGLHLVNADEAPPPLDADALVVRGPVLVLDAFVAALVRAGVGVRELTPVISPLEAAFLSLTETADAVHQEGM